MISVETATSSFQRWHKNLNLIKRRDLGSDQGLCDMQQVRFNELPLTDKALLIAEFGKYLESIEFYDYWIHLYALHSNFIEIYYNIHTRQIDKISLANYYDLDKYLNRIVVHGIRCR